MEGVLTVIFAFAVFLIVLSKGYLAAIRPMSLIILIIVSLVVGYVIAMLIRWLFSGFITIVAVLLIVGAITLFIFK